MTSTSCKHSRDAWDVPNNKSVVPKSVSDIKLVHAGKVLANGKTLAESRVHFGDLPGGVSTMHVVVQPPIPKKKTMQTRTRRRIISRIHAHALSFELGKFARLVDDHMVKHLKAGYIRGLGHGRKPSKTLPGKRTRAQLKRENEAATREAEEQ